MHCISANTVLTERKRENAKLRALHETTNERIKMFNAVQHIFRHHVSLHGFILQVFARLEATMFSSGDNEFEIKFCY